MTKFNKRVLAVAIAGAIMLPGAASAATMVFGSSQQITFAKDLIVNNGTTIYTPNDLDLRAAAIDAANMATVVAGGADTVRVKVTLTNGAKFDTTADAETLVEGFVVGVELGGAPTVIGVNGGGGPEIVGTPYYSTSGQELNFEITVPGPGSDSAVAGDYAIKLNSFQITNLDDAEEADLEIDAEITVQNSSGQQILAARQTIANFEWGITSSDLTSAYGAYRIDVAECAGGNRSRFSSTGAVGACDATLFNAGGMTLDITETEETDGATDSYINNFSAVAAVPFFNVVNTATWTFVVSGSNLNAFTGGDLFLSNSATCATVDSAFGTIAAGAASATLNVAAGSALVANLSAASPGPENIYVCFQADDTQQMVPQSLNLAWSIDYDLPTQRVNPPGDDHDLLPLLLNGTTITFQNVNPGANATAQSFLRITNHNDFECPIVIDAKDDAGVYTEDSDNVVAYTLGAQSSKQFNIDALENGDAAFTGMLGDGTGKWYVRVTAECANVIGSALNRNNNDGTVTNLTHERNDDQNLFGR